MSQIGTIVYNRFLQNPYEKTLLTSTIINSIGTQYSTEDLKRNEGYYIYDGIVIHLATDQSIEMQNAYNYAVNNHLYLLDRYSEQFNILKERNVKLHFSSGGYKYNEEYQEDYVKLAGVFSMTRELGDPTADRKKTGFHPEVRHRIIYNDIKVFSDLIEKIIIWILKSKFINNTTTYLGFFCRQGVHRSVSAVRFLEDLFDRSCWKDLIAGAEHLTFKYDLDSGHKYGYWHYSRFPR